MQINKTSSMCGKNNVIGRRKQLEYYKIQKIKNTKHEKVFYNATLLVDNVPINFIIDSCTPVFPECLFYKIIPLEPLKTTFKDVNYQQINFARQTKATLRTNKEALELPLLITLITKVQTAPHKIGLKWMQRLKMYEFK